MGTVDNSGVQGVNSTSLPAQDSRTVPTNEQQGSVDNSAIDNIKGKKGETVKAFIPQKSISSPTQQHIPVSPILSHNPFLIKITEEIITLAKEKGAFHRGKLDDGTAQNLLDFDPDKKWLLRTDEKGIATITMLNPKTGRTIRNPETGRGYLHIKIDTTKKKK